MQIGEIYKRNGIQVRILEISENSVKVFIISCDNKYYEKIEHHFSIKSFLKSMEKVIPNSLGYFT